MESRAAEDMSRSAFVVGKLLSIDLIRRLHISRKWFIDSEVLMQAKSLKLTDSFGKDVLHVTSEMARTNFQNIQLRGKAQAMKSLQV